MVEFGSGYFNLMDRSYEHQDHSHHQHGFPAGSEQSTGDVGVRIGEMGTSLGLGPVPSVQALAARIRPGAKTVELTFTGAGKGTGQSQTPEYYGEKQRQALQEISKANRVDFTTHSTIGIAGLAGMDRSGNFSKADKNFSLQEVKRAIEFAADVGRGGPIVVHTGEFQRPIADAKWNEKGPYEGKFRMYEGEENAGSYRVVDARTGHVIQEARRNKDVSRPVWLRAKNDYDYEDEETGKIVHVKKDDYIDYFDRKIDPAERVPEFDPEKNHFKVKQYGWNDLVYEAKEMTTRAKEEFEGWEKKSEEEKQKSIWREKIQRIKDLGLKKDSLEVLPEEAYIIAALETNAAHSRGWAMQYSKDFKDNVDNYKKLKKAYSAAKEMYETADEDKKRELLMEVKDITESIMPGVIPPNLKYKHEIIEQHLKRLKQGIEQEREAASSQWAQAEEAMETIRHVESAETYALREAYDSYAQAGIVAMRQTEKLQKKGELKKPLAIAMENLFPEQYGSHPDELIDLVVKSRERMAKILQDENKLSSEQALDIARKHITATLDTGHFNTWRKYWKGEKNQTIEQNDKDFDNWMLDRLKDMTKKGIIGHIHLDDNYGYHDDHLAPGEGNTPISAMIKVLKENGYKGEMIIEPGADFPTDPTGFSASMKAWRNLGMPVYGSGSGAGGVSRRNWNQVGYGFLGQNQPPYFVFGAYVPSEDWTLWSGVQLE